ncbi:MAG: GntR family transcriptional regulator [Kiritimatiellae bacterium]|nr:GntR family transcriptional regulator [Kiritimatiellia bacterium]MBQ3343753.1 GntR family transcriptional regulator [Kiritimatiellia bacterium]MBQ6328203.1 GntR family transcriptional regulator [Kiritimatiellia bacterium]
MKRVPFTIDRSQWGALVDQMTDGLRRAIRTGFYKPGDRLPSVRELVAHFGVSNRVPVAAIKKLCEEGLVDAAPRNGCVVRHARMPHWKGHVMCIVPSGDFSYGIMMMVERIRTVIFRANYLFTQVTVPRGKSGHLDMGVLDYHFRQPVDIAVLLDDDKRLCSRLTKAEIPFVNVDGECGGTCIGTFRHDFEDAFRAFVLSCRECGVKRVIRVAKMTGHWKQLSRILDDEGIEDEEWNLSPRRQGEGRLEILRDTAYRAFASRIVEGSEWLPDAFVFTDDYLATGAVAALLEAGVRFPKDVRIATLSNRGNHPVIPGVFGCFEFDPFTAGEMLADGVLAWLRREARPSAVAIPVHWKEKSTCAQ